MDRSSLLLHPLTSHPPNPQEIAEAYETLSSPEKRREYDQARQRAEQEARFRAQHRGGGGGQHHGFDFGGGGWRGNDDDGGGFFGGGGSGGGWVFSDPFALFDQFFDGMGGGLNDLLWEYEDVDDDGGYFFPPGGTADNRVVFEEEERYVLGGQEYVRVQRVYGDGRTEVETIEVPSRSGGGGGQKGGTHMPRPPPPNVHHDAMPTRLYMEETLEVGEQLLSTNGRFQCFIDPRKGTLVVAENTQGGHVVWESEEEDEDDAETVQRARRRQQVVRNSRLVATVTRHGRLELYAVGGMFSGGDTLLWRSTEEEGGPYLDDFLSAYEYVLSLSDTGNLLLRSVAKGGEGEEEDECIWASRGCQGEAQQALQEFGRRVLFPLFRQCKAGIRALSKSVFAFTKNHGLPGLRKGAVRLQGLMKKAGKKLKQAMADRRQQQQQRDKKATKRK